MTKRRTGLITLVAVALLVPVVSAHMALSKSLPEAPVPSDTSARGRESGETEKVDDSDPHMDDAADASL